MPWSRLTYSPRLGGYEVDIGEEELRGAPKYDPSEQGAWDREQGRKIYDYYSVPPYWI